MVTKKKRKRRHFTPEYRAGLRWYVAGVVFLIALSTVLLKRHYFVDVPAASLSPRSSSTSRACSARALADATRPIGPKDTQRFHA